MGAALVGEYVRGRVSTNGIENHWSLLKRTYIGIYRYWSDNHLARGVDEHSFRYNHRTCAGPHGHGGGGDERTPPDVERLDG